MTIRPPRLDEALVLAALHQQCWQEAYAGLLTPDQIAAPFADREARVATWAQIIAVGRTHVADRDGGLVGFASWGPGRGEDPPTEVELYAIYTRSSEWGSGTGSALLEAAIGARAAFLWALAGNDRAIAFYAKHGFSPDGAVDDQPGGQHVRLTRP